MRISDFLHFFRQVFFPNWKPKEIDEDGKPGRLTVWLQMLGKRFRSRENIGTLVSVLFHLLILFLLSLFFMPVQPGDGFGTILSGVKLPQELTGPNNSSDIDIATDKPSDSAPQTNEVVSESAEPNENAPASTGKTPEAMAVPDPGEAEAAPDSLGIRKIPGFGEGGGFSGRGNRTGIGGLGQGDGGKSENAVEAGLAWLAAHQGRDGGWTFDFPCCANAGKHGSRNAATALALLSFLGAGYTHEEGKYQRLVASGLAFLLARGVAGQMTGTIDYREGDRAMYAHGLTAIVLCEAYAMSRKKLPRLHEAAQGAINYIELSQDHRTGGWRYPYPVQTPDISVSAWQIMALKSAQLANLRVARQTVYWASDFLDSVEMDGGRQYNYQPERGYFSGTGPDSQRTCSASGLLLRMYLGWEPGEKMLDEGIEMIERLGPLRPGETECGLYYAYYATLALHHYGGSGWNRWAFKLSGFLVHTQAKSGHESGSWYFPDQHADAGGRLLNTSLAILILETPYRILPLYRKP